MSDIKVGDTWEHKTISGHYVAVSEISNNEVFYHNEIGYPKIAKTSVFLENYNFYSSKKEVEVSILGNEPSISVGDVWKHKIKIDCYVKVGMVTNGEVFYVNENGGQKGVESNDQFLTFYSLYKSAEPTVAVGSVWRCKEDGELVYIESDDNGFFWNLDFSPLGETDMYADNTDDFLSNYEFVCDSKYDVPVALGDAINPDHYQSDPSGVQCIEISENWSFCLGNALKYMWRSGKKDSSKNIEDLQKAIWYIEREISRLGKGGV